MTTKYKHSDTVPTEVLAKRLDELSDAVVARMNRDNNRFDREFTCRIPCELDRDADVVLSEAAKRLTKQDKRITELEKHKSRIDLIIQKFGIQSCINDEVDLINSIVKRDLKQQAKGIKDALNHRSHGAILPNVADVNDYLKQLLKQAKGGAE